MIVDMVPPTELLRLEDYQLRLFMTGIREIGEEKSDLYPEPQYFNASLMGVAANWRYILDKVTARCGSPAKFGQRAQRVLSLATGLHISIIATIVTHGREMLLLQDNVPGQRPGVVFDDGELLFTDDDVGSVLRFAYDATRHYRQDGRVYPADDNALGSNFRILPPNEADGIAAQTTTVDIESARHVLELMAAIRSLSFLMEAETREGLMVHGPYPVGESGDQLIIFECNDLRWPLFPNFPISGGVSWSLPSNPFPTANLAIALVLRNVNIKADRHGTLYIDPMAPANVMSASLLSRGSNPYRDEGLTIIPISEAKSLRRICDDIQEYMFLQVASWSKRQRVEAAIFQEEMVLLRILAAAGYHQAELEQEQQVLFERCARVYERHFDSIMSLPSQQLPFFRKVSDFVVGKVPNIFSPLSLSGVPKNEQGDEL